MTPPYTCIWSRYHPLYSITPRSPQLNSAMSVTERNQRVSLFLRLPAELRLQIYESVIPSRVVHVRMKWSGICTPAGFQYICLEDTDPLLASHERKTLSHAVPFGPELRVLSQTCRQIHRETAHLPFETHIWSFETAFTLDQWVSMKSQVPLAHKNTIRTVAVPTPGPYRSSERILLSLHEVLLVGNAHDKTTNIDQDVNSQTPKKAILILKKDKIADTWVRSGERAQFAKDLFE